MFERFTGPARVVVVMAQEEARAAGCPHVGAEHLLRGVLDDDTGAAATVLRRWGVDAGRASEAARAVDLSDEDALAALGIDLDEVRRRTEDTFGPGALDTHSSAPRPRWGRRAAAGRLPFTDEAKGALEGALRAAVQAQDREISPTHLFLGLIDVRPGTTMRLLQRLGVTVSADELRRLVRRALDQAA